MKAFYKILMFTALIQVFTSCDGYLDLVPDNVATVESAFTNRAAAEKFYILVIVIARSGGIYLMTRRLTVVTRHGSSIR